MENNLKSGEITLATIDSKPLAEINDKIGVIFDMEKTHLFDKDTEQALY